MIVTHSGHTAQDALSSGVEVTTQPSVLLIACEDDVAIALEGRSQETGLAVHVAVDGLGAVDQLRRSVPAAVVIDADPLGAASTSLAEELRDWGFPVVLTTSAQDRPVIPDVTVIEKPFEMTDLHDVLAQIMKSAEARADVQKRPRNRVLSP